MSDHNFNTPLTEEEFQILQDTYFYRYSTGILHRKRYSKPGKNGILPSRWIDLDPRPCGRSYGENRVNRQEYAPPWYVTIKTPKRINLYRAMWLLYTNGVDVPAGYTAISYPMSGSRIVTPNHLVAVRAPKGRPKGLTSSKLISGICVLDPGTEYLLSELPEFRGPFDNDYQLPVTPRLAPERIAEIERRLKETGV